MVPLWFGLRKTCDLMCFDPFKANSKDLGCKAVGLFQYNWNIGCKWFKIVKPNASTRMKVMGKKWLKRLQMIAMLWYQEFWFQNCL